MASSGRRLCSAVILIGLASIAIGGCSDDVPRPRERLQYSLADLRSALSAEQTAATTFVDKYVPPFEGRLDDLTHSYQLFASLPGVNAGHLTEAKQRRIIHLCDWHLLGRDQFVADFGGSLSDQDIDELYERHLLQVDLVQLEQMVVLRCMIRHHGLDQVFCEGLTLEDMPAYKLIVESLRRMEEQIPGLATEQLEARQDLAELAAEGKQPSDEYIAVEKLEQGIESLRQRHRLDMLKIGAVGRLYLTGELRDVLPLEDEQAYERAKPSPTIDPKANEAREDAQLRNLLKNGPFAFIVLGGGHDLSGSLVRLGVTDCNYVRVHTKWYRRFGGIYR